MKRDTIHFGEYLFLMKLPKGWETGEAWAKCPECDFILKAGDRVTYYCVDHEGKSMAYTMHFGIYAQLADGGLRTRERRQ